MSTEPETLGPFDPAKKPREAFETSFEVELDEEPPRKTGPVYVDVVAHTDELRPIVPASWRTVANAKATVRRMVARWWHIGRWHALRSPWHLLLVVWFALAGVVRLAGQQRRWWWVAEQNMLRQAAATGNDPETWSRLTREARAIRLYRGIVLLAEVVGLVAAVVLLWRLAPTWVVVLAVVVVVPLLARAGRPGQKVIGSAVVAHRHRKLRADIVLRAYYAAGLGHPDKPAQQVEFLSTMARDPNETGSQVTVALPFGVTFSDAMKSREAIASGLDVALSQVYLHRDPASNRSHMLWVADDDPLAKPAGRTPLLRCRPTDIWQPAPFGLDERGNRVSLDLLWNSILIGAQPRQGKTFSARLLALYAALDPYVKLTVFDGAGKPDWRKFALVADRCGFGLAVTRDGDPVEILLDTLRDLKDDVQQRYERLSRLPVDVCPEGKLTREIARDPRYGMPVRMLVLDEFQEYFDLGDDSKEIANLLVYLGKVAPAAGIITVDATQRPSGVGTRQIAQQFISFRDNHQVRFSLRTGSWQVSDLVLGAGAYSEGHDSSTLLPTYKGVGILRGASDATPTVRTYLADAEDAEKILVAARAHRERLGLLTGMAAGEDVAKSVRDVLNDVRSVFYAGEARISWPELAERMRDQMPEHYADLTPDVISAQVRGLGVPAKSVKDRKHFESGTGQGFDLKALDEVMHQRALSGSGSG